MRGYNVPDGRTWFRKAYPNAEYRHTVISAWKNDYRDACPGERKPRIFTVTCNDGSHRTVNLISSVLASGDHLMTCEDITDRKQTEEALKESEDRYRNVSGTMADYVYSCTRTPGGEYAIDWIAGATEQITGYSIDEIRDWGCWKPMVHPDHSGMFDDNIMGLPPNTARECEIKIVRKNGEERWVKSQARCVLGTDGSSHRLYGACVDITDRKKAEEALLESEERFRLIIENATYGIFVQTQYRFAYLNPEAVKLFGAKSADQLLGQPVLDRFDPLYHDLVRERIRLLNEEKQAAPILEQTYLKLDGSPFAVEAGAVPTRWKDHDGAFVFFHDITGRKRAEDRVRSLLSEKDLLLKEVHHRIKNNMSVVMGLLSLQSDTLKDPAAVAALQDSRNRVQSMMVLYEKLYRSNDFRAISAKEYLPALINEIMSNFPNRMHVDVETRIDDMVLDARILSPIGIIINELLTNTMKHAFDGRDSGRIDVSFSIKDSHATLIVEDDGIGIPESADIATGFGIQLVTTLVEQFDGTIRIERQDGIRFVLTFGV